MLLLAPILVCSVAATYSGDHVISQRDRKFSATSLHAKVGETVVFVNNDPYVHNIFSMSDAQSFDLGTFGKGEARTIKLSKPGVIEVGCAIHPEMKLTIEVSNFK